MATARDKDITVAGRGVKKFKFKAEDIDDSMVDLVENLVGMGAGAWDCVDPKEIIAAAWNGLVVEGTG